MVEFKDFDESNIREYSTDNLKMFIREIEMKKSVIYEQCSSEMHQKMKDKKFDTFSFFGSRKLRKIADKYTPSLIGADDYLRIIKLELSRREKLEEEMRYSGNSLAKRKTEKAEDFLRREEDKTKIYRSKIE